MKWSSEPAEAGFAIRRLLEEVLGPNDEIQSSTGALRNDMIAKRAPNTEETSSMPRRQMLTSLTSLVQETQHAFVSEDPLLQRHLAQIYKELGEQRMEMRQLRLAIEQPRESKNDPVKASNCKTGLSGCLVNPALDLDNTDDSDSTAADIFFDCILRFSTNSSSLIIDRVQAKFSGLPDYCLEIGPSFYLEQYLTESLFNEPVFIMAMKTSLEDNSI